MAPSDITAILTSLSELGVRMTTMVDTLARLDERTLVLTDHETRIRAAEEAAKGALAKANEMRRVADSLEVRMQEVEAIQGAAGKFTIGTLGRVVAAIAAFVLAVISIATIIHQWG